MKKFLALLMALAMLFSLAACSSSSDDSDEAEDTTAEETTEEEEEEEEEEADEEEAEEEEDTADTSENEVLTIGGLVNQTGWFATYDYNNALEMQALADYYNDQGGIVIGDTTYTIEVVVEDGQSDTEGIRSAAQLLADNEDINYVIETNDFWVESALDIFEEAGIMNIMSQNNLNYDALNENWTYAYNFYNSCPAQFYAALVFAVDYYGIETVVYCCDDNGSNDEQAALVEEICEELGLEYIDSPVVFDAESTDFSAIALQLMNSGADLFIGNGDVTNTGSIVKELRNNGSNMVAAAVVGSNASMLIEASGLDDLSYAFTMGSDLDNEENNTEIFNEIYNYFKEQYGEDTASSWCGASIQNMYTLLQLMVGAGSIEVADVQAYYDSITTVETLYGTGVIGGLETFGINHVVAHPNSITVAVDGEVVYGGTVDCTVS